jgi:hypothetical protein|tara:strand:+ start:315 stop:473 length:159 start_codon:yes stop_codon:yes gene_type:complete
MIVPATKEEGFRIVAIKGVEEIDERYPVFLAGRLDCIRQIRGPVTWPPLKNG